MTRYALLTRGGDPHIWDFGSAAKHHRLFAPWMRPENVHAGMIGLRGAVAPDAGLFAGAAREIAGLLRDEGVADMPLGVDLVEPPMLAALEARGIEVASVSVARPSLDDVYLRHTGRTFDKAEAEAEEKTR
jgi:Xaa-Pro dipeptidase